QDAKAVGSCRCYLEVLEQDARAGDEGCCYLPAWEQDAKMVGNREEFNAAVSDVLQLSEKGRVGGRKFKWLCGLLAVVEAGSAAVGKQQIWSGIAHLDAQAAAEAGLSWPRLPSGRIRRCGCRPFARSRKMVKICYRLTTRRELALGKRL
ncbi:hypothetical protein BHE74_00051648, partial [Ensete ventricosum]